MHQGQRGILACEEEDRNPKDGEKQRATETESEREMKERKKTEMRESNGPLYIAISLLYWLIPFLLGFI